MKQFIPQSFCLKCLGCCRFADYRSKWSPFLLDEEIRGFKKKHIPVFLRPKTKKLRLIRPAHTNMGWACPFFDIEKNRCRIYSVRMLDCRLYPFLLRKKNNRHYLAVDLNCPYIEKTFKGKKFRKYLNYLIKFFNRPRIKKMIARNPGIFGSFHEKSVQNLACLRINK